jgi:hypothetical protein
MSHPITRLAAAVLAAMFVALPGAALAQEETPSSDLAAAFPDTLEGADLPVEAWDGQAWLDRADPASPDGQVVAERTQALLDATGKSITDLEVASALHEPSEGNHAAITAVRVAGASAADLVRPTIALLLGDVANPELQVRGLGSRYILRVSDADRPGVYPRTVYSAGDTVWVVDAEQPLLLEILDALPDTPADEPVDAAPELVAQIPYVLGGERRSQVQVTTGWGSLLSTAPDEMFGPQFAETEVRLFLDEGLTAQDLTSVLGIWDTSAEGIFVVGFEIAGASQADMESVLEEVIVPAISLTSQQPTVTQQEIAGRDVTVVSDEAVEGEDRVIGTFYFVVSGDTVWMVNLAAADDAILTEAFGALPPAA